MLQHNKLGEVLQKQGKFWISLGQQMKVFYWVHNVPIECIEIMETFIFISEP